MRSDSLFPWYFSQLLVLVGLVGVDLVWFLAPWDFPPNGHPGVVRLVLTQILTWVFIPGLVFSLGINQAIMFSRRARRSDRRERLLLAAEFIAIAACVTVGVMTDWVGAFFILQIACVVLAALAFSAIHEGSAS